MSKLSYLKIKWNEPNLSTKKITKYNAKSREIYWKIVRIELLIEEYLYKSLNAFDWKKDKPFVNKYSSEISWIIYKNKNKELKQSDFIYFLIKKATIGNKILFWKALKSKIFNDKNSIFINTNQHEITNKLENLRNLRNSIAHYEGLFSWKSKMRPIEDKVKLDDIILATLKGWRW